MKMDSSQIVSISEANQNFSRVARMAESVGTVVIFKNNRPKYKLPSPARASILQSGAVVLFLNSKTCSFHTLATSQFVRLSKMWMV